MTPGCEVGGDWDSRTDYELRPVDGAAYDDTADKLGGPAAAAVALEVREAPTWADLVERVDGAAAE